MNLRVADDVGFPRHLHEVEDGRTSSISTHMAGGKTIDDGIMVIGFALILHGYSSLSGIDSSGRIVRSDINLHETFPLSPPPCRISDRTALGDHRDWNSNLRVAPPTGFPGTDSDGDLADSEEPKVISFSDLAGECKLFAV